MGAWPGNGCWGKSEHFPAISEVPNLPFGPIDTAVLTCPDVTVERWLTMWLSVGSGCTCCVMKC